MSHPRGRGHDPDRRFAERLAHAYRPAPLDAVQRTRFDAALRERVGGRRRSPGLLPALAAGAAALAVAWAVWPAAVPNAPVEAVGRPAPTGTAPSWGEQVVLADAETTLAEDTYLPDEYRVIAFAFIDGR